MSQGEISTLVDTAVNISVGLTLIVVLSAVSLPAFRGFHGFFDNLQLYHKLPRDYDPIVAYRGSPPNGYTAEDFVTDDELYQQQEPEIKAEKSIPDSKDPEVVIDFDEGYKRLYGEHPSEKFKSLWYYTAATTTAAVAMVTLYLAILTSVLELSTPISVYLIPVAMVIVAFHLVIRVVTLSKRFTYDATAVREEFQTDVHDFAFSFFMSLYFSWVIVAVIFGFTGRFETINPTIEPSLLVVFVLVLLVGPAISAALSHVILRSTGVCRDLCEDQVREEMELKGN
jgi:hypothetical protein